MVRNISNFIINKYINHDIKPQISINNVHGIKRTEVHNMNKDNEMNSHPFPTNLCISLMYISESRLYSNLISECVCTINELNP